MPQHPTPTRDGLDADWAETIERLRSFVEARLGNREVAADITQDVIVRSIASGALEQADNPVAWLYRSARNAVIDHYRTRHAHDPIENGDWPDPDGDDEAPNDATRELAHCMRPMIEHLPPAAREALQRVDIDGETHQKVATELGLSVSGMKSRVQRARRDLKDLLEGCCVVELDRLGAVSDYEHKGGACGCRANQQ